MGPVRKILRVVHAPEHRPLTRRRVIVVNGSGEINSASCTRQNRDVAERRRSEIADVDNPNSKAHPRIDRRLFALVHLAGFRLGITRLNLNLRGNIAQTTLSAPTSATVPRIGGIPALE